MTGGEFNTACPFCPPRSTPQGAPSRPVCFFPQLEKRRRAAFKSKTTLSKMDSTKSRAEGAATTYKESTTGTNVRFFTPQGGGGRYTTQTRNAVSGVWGVGMRDAASPRSNQKLPYQRWIRRGAKCASTSDEEPCRRRGNHTQRIHDRDKRKVFYPARRGGRYTTQTRNAVSGVWGVGMRDAASPRKKP